MFTLSSCIQKEVKGIKLGHNLYDTQGWSYNRILCKRIDKTLQKDPIALKEIINGSYGGGAGDYDLGEVVVQIICKIGESEFIKLAVQLNSEERNHLRQYIEAGLEYGNEYFFEVKNKRNIKKQFPKLEIVLQK